MYSTIQATEDFDTDLENQLREIKLHRRAESFKVEQAAQAERSRNMESKISQLRDATYRASLKNTLVSILEARPRPKESRLSESKARWHNDNVETIIQNFVNEDPAEEMEVLQWPSKKEDWSVGVPLASCDPDEFRLEITPVVRTLFDPNGKTRGQLTQQSVAVPWEPVATSGAPPPSSRADDTVKQILQAASRTAAWWGTGDN